MSTIWKFQMPRPGRPMKTKIPACARPLSVQVQDGEIMLWAEINPHLTKIDVIFETIGTGREVPAGFHHLGTVQQNGAVWHVYGSGIGERHG